MEDLKDIVNLGFSGADIIRALIITFTIAIVPRRKRSAWALGALALLVDRLIWPITGMAVAGSDIHSIYASIAALGKTFVDDLGLYVVRYLGLVIMIEAFTAFRSTLVARVTPRKEAAA